MNELPTSYDAQEIESRISALWERSGYFNPDNLGKGQNAKRKGRNDKRFAIRAKPFSMVLPPPNATGILHMGHALMLTIQDVMARYHRMKGEKTLWIPGTDHAAIATQERVERELYKKEGKRRQDLGREEFLRRVNEFVETNRTTIRTQLKKMGASLDWSREAFTLDEPRTRAVHEAFKRMYDAGLIYRGERIVNWDPKLQTTVSDDEVEWREEKAPFYYLKYGPFVIATARPETKFGDKYVVMHPSDKRYAKWKHGDTLEVEWINGKVTATIIKDKAVDPKFGTGVMTITPWHDTADFDIAERHKLEKQQIIDVHGRLLPIAGEFAGQKILAARPLIVEKLRAKGLLEKIDENYTHRVAVSQRGGGLIEPQIMKQWFVNINSKFKSQNSKLKGIKAGQETTLKEIMLKAVQSGQIKIIPERFKKIYFHWIKNLRDWCISRQIWYGHRIPVWYCGGCGDVRVDADVKGRWFFVRHGETEFNKNKIFAGHSGVSLNEVGNNQVNITAECLVNEKIDLIISSDLPRCRETAEILKNKLHVRKIIFDRGLRERNDGELTGMNPEEVEKKYGNLYGYDTRHNYELHPPGGESYKELEERAGVTFESYFKKYGYKNVVIVSHGGTLRTLQKRIRNWNPDEMFTKGNTAHAGILSFDVSDICIACGSHFFEQDPDTLDTWFSSGLWTFSTLGWPSFAKASDGKPSIALAKGGKPSIPKENQIYHPTTVLETGYDILFFWVARMILMTGFLLGDVPFKTVYLNGLVRGEDRQKMSKSKGNAIDPLGVADIYGTDAVRMALIVGNAPGNDPIISEDKIRGYRNFATKIWNIARFILMNAGKEQRAMPTGRQAKGKGHGEAVSFTTTDKKRLKEFAAFKKTVTKDMDEFRFHEASANIYHYLWHTFADKIIEEAKPRLSGTDEKEKHAAYALLTEIFTGCLKLLHPFMPFVTEELYQRIGTQKRILMFEAW